MALASKSEVHPELATSIKYIHCHITEGHSKVQEVLHNFKVSVRGELRKGPSIMTWVQTLQTLRGFGETDVPSIIRRFNSDVPKEHQLLGQKAQSVKNLLDIFPACALELVREHVQQCGWSSCCFSDDCLSSKKVLPGWKWRNGCQGHWPEWSKATDHSCLLMLKRAIAQFTSTDEDKRKKLSRGELEKLAEQAAFAAGIALTMQSEVAISDEEVNKAWLAPFAEGELSVLLEVQSALQSRDEKLVPRGIKSLADLPFGFAMENVCCVCFVLVCWNTLVMGE